MSTAWFCPSCQKYHAPHVKTCPGPGGMYSLEPYKGWHERDGMTTVDLCANCKGACGNAACPRRYSVECATTIISIMEAAQ